ncbi:MAG: hypothetical protein ACI35O_12340, partial [Bacillaceae bacterium]
MMYLGGHLLHGTISIDKENPDLFIEINSPKQHTGLIDSRLWYTNDGAIIGIRNGESWDQIKYTRIN